MRLIDADALFEKVGKIKPKNKSEYELLGKFMNMITYSPTVERPHGEWEALGFQQGYAFCRCSNCHKTTRLYRDSKNEFCCIADIRKKVVSCMYCGADMRKERDNEK